MRFFKYIGAAGLVAAALAALAAYVVFYRPLPDYTGVVAVPGLRDTVKVYTDEFGIPHVFAENEADLFFAQGYLTARERLFQMELTRRAGRGELAALLGERALDDDRLSRTIGFYRLARREYRSVSKGMREVLRAYTRGVNAFIKTARLPSEFTLLRAEPGAWTPEDSIAAGLMLAYGMSVSRTSDLIVYRIGRAVGPGKLPWFVPPYPEWAPYVSGPGPPPPHWLTAELVEEENVPPGRPAGFEPGLLWDVPASSWTAFSGARTASGKPIFSGGPELPTRAPAMFFIIHLHAAGLNVMGGSLPGAPGILMPGFNGSLAWSAVNGRMDELDYFIERVHPDDPGKYLTEKGYRDFDVSTEAIRVRTGRGFREESLTIRRTRHGPIVSDVLPLAPENCAMQWVGFESSGLWEGFLAVARAGNFDEFRRALSHIRTPTLNVGYADAAGRIGYQCIARPPIRKKGDGLTPGPGWTGESDWTGYVDFEDLPHGVNPVKGYLGAFNNPARSTPFHAGRDFLFERAARFETIMGESGVVTLQAAHAWRLDAVSGPAQRWVPLILEACAGQSELTEHLSLLRAWDRSMGPGSAAASLFQAFYFCLMKNTLADDVGPALWERLARPGHLYIPHRTLTGIMNDPDHPLFDRGSTKERENRRDMIRESLSEAVEFLTEHWGGDPEKWRWGDTRRAVFVHPLGETFGLYNIPIPPPAGDGFTLNAISWEHGAPFYMSTGGVLGMTVDFSNADRSTILGAPGQSGHLFSPHYKDQARLWSSGEQAPMRFAAPGELDRVLVLRPE